MRVLLVGPGVVGTVYGLHLAADGHELSVLARGNRTHEIAASGLVASDNNDGIQLTQPATVVSNASEAEYDVILIAVRRDQLSEVAADLSELVGHPRLLFMGNNPDCRAGIAAELSARASLGFPGIGGTMVDGIARYIRIRQQPTVIETGDDPRLAAIEASLRRRGFAVQRVENMDGWLAYHAVFVACIAASLYRCGTVPTRLAADSATLRLMCQAISSGFATLRAAGVVGCPRNLAILHRRWMRPIAERYWARAMGSPMGELCFAAHCRHAEAEMRALGALGADVLVAAAPPSRALTKLLAS